MSSIDRPLTGDLLVFELDEERAHAADPELLERSGRSARTLLKSGSLRVTLIALAPGGELAEHSADGPITVQVLDGQLRLTTGSEVHDLGPGQLLAVGPGIPHAVTSDEGGSFLLTVCQAARGE